MIRWHSETALALRAVAGAGLGFAALLALGQVATARNGSGSATAAAPAALPRESPPAASATAPPAPARGEPLGCAIPDPVGMGPWTAWQPLAPGELTVPQRGGHREDGSFDVVLHFHAHDALRKVFVGASRGAVLFGADLGSGSAAYARAFPTRPEWLAFRQRLTRALAEHTGVAGARIGHLALSAWSAGYGAVNEILRHDPEGVDAVILLDGLHASWKRGPVRGGTPEDVSGTAILPVVRFAHRATDGAALFFFTHSEVEPPSYPSTALTASWLARELALGEGESVSGAHPYSLRRRRTRAGAHLWSYGGASTEAHCAHLGWFADALKLVEAEWRTPELDRSVPATPPPPPRSASGTVRRPLLELVPE